MPHSGVFIFAESLTVHKECIDQSKTETKKSADTKQKTKKRSLNKVALALGIPAATLLAALSGLAYGYSGKTPTQPTPQPDNFPDMPDMGGIAQPITVPTNDPETIIPEKLEEPKNTPSLIPAAKKRILIVQLDKHYNEILTFAFQELLQTLNFETNLVQINRENIANHSIKSITDADIDGSDAIILASTAQPRFSDNNAGYYDAHKGILTKLQDKPNILIHIYTGRPGMAPFRIENLGLLLRNNAGKQGQHSLGCFNLFCTKSATVCAPILQNEYDARKSLTALEDLLRRLNPVMPELFTVNNQQFNGCYFYLTYEKLNYR